LWVIDSILRGVYEKEVVAFTPIVSMMILIAIIIKLAEIVRGVL
jgi:hypothetical protein